jgi:hypothetical protein
VAVRGVLHLGLIKTGLLKATPLAQASRIEIVSDRTLAMQVDGEPSMVPPSRVTIALSDRYVHKFISVSSRLSQCMCLGASLRESSLNTPVCLYSDTDSYRCYVIPRVQNKHADSRRNVIVRPPAYIVHCGSEA